MKKYYAIKKGRQPGIYQNWPAAQAQIKGFAGAVYKGFNDLTSAQAFLKGESVSTQQPTSQAAAIWLVTDGGTRNTGNYAGGHVRKTDKAAWAYLIKKDMQKWSASAGQWGATNNQMELMAVLKGLEKLRALNYHHQTVVLVSDSRYVINALTKGWLQSWQRRGWKKADGQAVLNRDLWQKIAQQLHFFSAIQFTWTKGHANNQDNNFVDRLLNQTMDKMKTP